MRDTVIEAKNISLVHQKGTPWESIALDDVSLTVGKGSFLGICGPSGSGKTSLLRVLSGLVSPQSGTLAVDGRCALAFQFPESQMFKATVLEDVMYGPMNLGLSEEESRRKAALALAKVGLSSDLVGRRSPFSLSGGEKRRAALAGILSMEPEILLLDEPTAGLDYRGHEALIELLMSLNSSGTTIIMASHDKEDIAKCCDSLVLLDNGRVVDEGSKEDVFARNPDKAPKSFVLERKLKELGVYLRDSI